MKRYRCFYITDADDYLRNRKSKWPTNPAEIAWDFDETGNARTYVVKMVDSATAQLIPVKSEFYIRTNTSHLVRLDNGDDYMNLVVFDMECSPPKMIHCTTQLDSLRKMRAPLPETFINQYGSIETADGEILLASEDQPKRIKINQTFYEGDFAKITAEIFKK